MIPKCSTNPDMLLLASLRYLLNDHEILAPCSLFFLFAIFQCKFPNHTTKFIILLQAVHWYFMTWSTIIKFFVASTCRGSLHHAFFGSGKKLHSPNLALANYLPYEIFLRIFGSFRAKLQNLNSICSYNWGHTNSATAAKLPASVAWVKILR